MKVISKQPSLRGGIGIAFSFFGVRYLSSAVYHMTRYDDVEELYVVDD